MKKTIFILLLFSVFTLHADKTKLDDLYGCNFIYRPNQDLIILKDDVSVFAEDKKTVLGTLQKKELVKFLSTDFYYDRYEVKEKGFLFLTKKKTVVNDHTWLKIRTPAGQTGFISVSDASPFFLKLKGSTIVIGLKILRNKEIPNKVYFHPYFIIAFIKDLDSDRQKLLVYFDKYDTLHYTYQIDSFKRDNHIMDSYKINCTWSIPLTSLFENSEMQMLIDDQFNNIFNIYSKRIMGTEIKHYEEFFSYQFGQDNITETIIKETFEYDLQDHKSIVTEKKTKTNQYGINKGKIEEGNDFPLLDHL